MASEEIVPSEEKPLSKNSGCSSRTVILTIGDTSFTVSRTLLCENSHYFNAMLNGNFKEANQRQIHLHTISANAMECILNFFNFDTIEISNIDEINDIFHAANYFGLNTFYERVETKLISLIDHCTSFKLFNISKENNLKKLEPIIKSYILYNFCDIKQHICGINNINSLFWYLSHESLNVNDEIDVFNAGCKWLDEHSGDENGILVLLSCLVYKNLDLNSIKGMLLNKSVLCNENAKSVIEAMIFAMETFDTKNILKEENVEKILRHFNKSTYDILHGLLTCKENRMPPIRPCILRESKEAIEIMSFDVINKSLTSFLTISNQSWWGHNVVSWKGFNIFILCGKLKTHDVWNYNVRTYNCLTKKWKTLTSTNPVSRRHATSIVHEDSIYVIGGFGQFRILLKSVQVYNIKEDTWSNFPDIPELTASIVACFHKGNLFVSGENLYVFQNNNWQLLCPSSPRLNALLLYNDRLYFTEKWVTALSFWDCDIATMNGNVFVHSKTFKTCHHYVAAICAIRDTVYIFSEGDTIDPLIAVESCNLKDLDSRTTNLLWIDADSTNTYNSYSCFLLANLEITDSLINEYGKRWLS